MTQSIFLRDATMADAPALTAAIRAAFEEYRGKLNPPSGSHDESETVVAEKLQKGGGVLAYVAASLAGVVLYYPDKDDSLYLGRLAVLGDFRGFGVGKLLVSAVESKAKQLGYPRVSLAVRVQLPQNKSYFERLGYQLSSYETHAGFSEPTFMLLSKSV
jgi:predicted N-acetyltransferase YhbS